jgi:hypothetical protein
MQNVLPKKRHRKYLIKKHRGNFNALKKWRENRTTDMVNQNSYILIMMCI